MLRVLGIGGLGFLFVLISPALRVSLMDDAGKLQQTIITNSPWSYVAIGLGVLGLVMFAVHRAAQPRT
jgi:hypothetical protein